MSLFSLLLSRMGSRWAFWFTSSTTEQDQGRQANGGIHEGLNTPLLPEEGGHDGNATVNAQTAGASVSSQAASTPSYLSRIRAARRARRRGRVSPHPDTSVAVEGHADDALDLEAGNGDGNEEPELEAALTTESALE